MTDLEFETLAGAVVKNIEWLKTEPPLNDVNWKRMAANIIVTVEYGKEILRRNEELET